MAMTMGEMAQMFNAENKIGCDLHVIQMRNWRRQYWFDRTGLPWASPSPNLRSANAELLYPGLEILQVGGVSVGRGTDKPFEHFGAPWIRGDDLADYMNRRSIPGVRFMPERFTPDSGLYKGELCQGAKIVVTDRAAVFSMRIGIEIASGLMKLYPGKLETAKTIALVGNAETIHRLMNGDPPRTIVSGWDDELGAFGNVRAKYLLYRR
jgi:uncharacterized protein YbbC (DUF1343 family)